MLKEKLAQIPNLPGSYQMKNKDGIIIYVGKAKNLHKRVNSYFNRTQTGKTAKLVSEINDFSYIVTSSELEAFLLEINLIKEYDPKYNILLKDDKSYPYIEFIEHPYPKLKVSRYLMVKKKEHKKLYGPYPNAYAARRIVNLLNRLYPLKKCDTMSKKVCLYYHIGECLGYCDKNINSENLEKMEQEEVTKDINYLKDNVFNTVRNNKIDYLVLSHADADHIGGALAVLSNFEVDTIFMPSVGSNSQTYKNLCQYIEDNNLTSTTDYSGLVIDNGSYQIQAFGPLNFSDTNDSCAVIKISYAGFSFLFTGDIEATIDGNFVDEYGQALECDVLKVAHHGSGGASGEKFLACVMPEYAVISCGIDNRYNHPHQEALDRLNDVGAKIYRTDELGDILFVAGADYGLKELDGDYIIIGFKFNYLYIVIIVDVLLAINIVIVAVSKPSKRKVKKHK